MFNKNTTDINLHIGQDGYASLTFGKGGKYSLTIEGDEVSLVVYNKENSIWGQTVFSGTAKQFAKALKSPATTDN